MNDDARLPDTGLPTLDEGQLRVLRRLDAVLLEAAQACHAREIGFAPISSVASLSRIDYFRNFPHLGLAVAPLNPGAISLLASQPGGTEDSLESEQLSAPRYFLPSAACYPVYAHLANRSLASSECITTVQRCFRNEEHYEGLARLLAFSMREVVMVGSQSQVRDFLAAQKQWIHRFAESVGLALAVQTASDPFFESNGQRARMQQLFPVKEEFVLDGRVAVSSVNFHRNFFGERWNIRSADGEFAFSGCAAFGLERWLHALDKRWDHDIEAMLSALAGARIPAAQP